MSAIGDKLGSYLLYICVFFLSALGSYYYGKQDIAKMKFSTKFIYFLVIAGPVIILQGFRFNVGTDYGSYAELSRKIGERDIATVESFKNEPLFMLISGVCYIISGRNKYFFFIVDAVVINLLLFMTFSYFKEYERSLSLPVLYLMYYFICFSTFLNLERQGLATIIVWFSIRYILKGKPVKFITGILIATLIHNTAIVGLVLYPAYYLFTHKIGSSIRYVLIALCFFLPVLFGATIDILSKYIPIFSQYMDYTYNVDIGNRGINPTWVFIVLIAMMPMVTYYAYRKTRINCWFLLLLEVCSASMYPLSGYIRYGARLFFYFSIAIMYSYAALAGNSKLRINKCIVSTFAICMAFIWFTWKILCYGAEGALPYTSILMM